jgi:hypothetical protein
MTQSQDMSMEVVQVTYEWCAIFVYRQEKVLATTGRARDAAYEAKTLTSAQRAAADFRLIA